MDHLLLALQAITLVPVIVGSVYGVLCLATVCIFTLRRARAVTDASSVAWPPVTILKPVYGIDKHLEANLRSACTQDYPVYQVVVSVQRLNDPALPILRKIQEEFGTERVTIAAADSEPVVNGRAQNLGIAVGAARHDFLVISDSDMRLPPDYLRTIVRPLLEPGVGCACTLYRAAGAETWYECLELLSLNADFSINLIFANVTGASPFCLGGSTAVRRSTLDAIGGFAALREYLVDDFELGRRVRALGQRVALAPYFAETIMNLHSPREWWDHQVYWDQNTWAARPIGFLATVVLRAVPFGLAFAALRGFDALGLWTFAAAVAVRIATVGPMLYLIDDREGVRRLGWLPLRDLVGLASWLFALAKRHFVWRGLEFKLTRDGRIVPRQAS